MFIGEYYFFIFNRKFIFNELILNQKDFLEKYHFSKLENYPAFFRLLTKKSFSLVSKSNFDFLSFSLISEVEFFLILLRFISYKTIQKKNIMNPTDH